MAYDPMQYAQARAGLVGRNIENIGGTLQNLTNTLLVTLPQAKAEFAKMKDANKRIDTAVQQAQARFSEELVGAGMDKAKAAIQAKRYFMDRMPGETADKVLERLYKADEPAAKFLKEAQTKFNLGQATGAVDAINRTADTNRTMNQIEFSPEAQAMKTRDENILRGIEQDTRKEIISPVDIPQQNTSTAYATPQQVGDIYQKYNVPDADKSPQMQQAFGRQYNTEIAAASGAQTQSQAYQQANQATGQPPTKQFTDYAATLEKTAPDPLDQQKKQNEIALQEQRMRESKARIARWNKAGENEKRSFSLQQLQDDHQFWFNKKAALEKQMIDLTDKKLYGEAALPKDDPAIINMKAELAYADAKAKAFEKASIERARIEGMSDFAGDLEQAGQMQQSVKDIETHKSMGIPFSASQSQSGAPASATSRNVTQAAGRMVTDQEAMQSLPPEVTSKWAQLDEPRKRAILDRAKVRLQEKNI